MAGRVRAGTAYIDVRLGSFQQFKSAALAQAQQVGKQIANTIGNTVAGSTAAKNAGTKLGNTIGTAGVTATTKQFGRVGNALSRIIGPQGVTAAKDFFKQFGAGVSSLFSSSSQKFQFSSAAFRAAGSNAATVFSSAFNTIGPKILPGLQNLGRRVLNLAGSIGSGLSSAFTSLRSGLQTAGNAMRNFSQQMGLTAFMAQSLGYRLTFLATGPVLALAAGLGAIGISSALNLEQATAGIAAFTGGLKNAQKEVQILAKIAQNSPAFDTTQIIAYAKSLLAAGLSVQKTNALFQASSNIFTTLGLSVDEANGAFTAITQVMQKGKVQSEELTQQLAERGVPIWKILADAMGISQQKLAELVSQGKVTSTQFVDAMIKAGNSKTYLEGAGLGADTLKSKLANLKEQVQFQLAQAFETRLFPVLKQFIDKFGPQLIKLLTTLAIGVIPPLVAGLGVIADKIQGMANAYQNLSPQAKSAVKQLLGIAVAAGPVIIAISGIASSISAVVGAVGFLAANPEIALLIGVFALLGAAAVSARDKIVEFFQINSRGQKLLEGFKGLIDKIKGLFDGLKPFINGILTFLGQAFDGFFGTAKTDLRKASASKGSAGRDKDLTQAIAAPDPAVTKAFRELRGYLGDIAKIMKDDIAPAVQKVRDAFNEWTADPKRVLFLKAVLYTIVIVLGIIITTVALVVDVFASAFAGIVDIVSEVFGGIVDIVGGFFEIISGIFTGKWSAIKDGVMSILLGLAHLIYGTLGAMINAIISIVDSLVGPFIAPFKKAYDILVGHSIIPDLVNGIVGWVRRLPGAIVGAIASIPGAVAGIFRSMASQAVSAVSGMVSSVSSLASSIRGRVISAVGNLGGALVGAGKSLIQGLINGMRSMLDEVSSIAAQIAGKADQAVAHRLQAHSPSRVGFKRGQQFGQGFKLGMDDTRDAIVRSASMIASAAVPDAPRYDPASQVATFGGTQGDTIINVNVPAPVQDPAAIADYTVRSLASRLANKTI